MDKPANLISNVHNVYNFLIVFLKISYKREITDFPPGSLSGLISKGECVCTWPYILFCRGLPYSNESFMILDAYSLA